MHRYKIQRWVPTSWGFLILSSPWVVLAGKIPFTTYEKRDLATSAKEKHLFDYVVGNMLGCWWRLNEPRVNARVCHNHICMIAYGNDDFSLISISQTSAKVVWAFVKVQIRILTSTQLHFSMWYQNKGMFLFNRYLRSMHHIMFYYFFRPTQVYRTIWEDNSKNNQGVTATVYLLTRFFVFQP